MILFFKHFVIYILSYISDICEKKYFRQIRSLFLLKTSNALFLLVFPCNPFFGKILFFHQVSLLPIPGLGLRRNLNNIAADWKTFHTHSAFIEIFMTTVTNQEQEVYLILE